MRSPSSTILLALLAAACGSRDVPRPVPVEYGDGSESESESESEGGAESESESEAEAESESESEGEPILECPEVAACEACDAAVATCVCTLADDLSVNVGEADPVFAAADLGCLGGAYPDPLPDGDIEVYGDVLSTATRFDVEDALVEVFASEDALAAGTPLASDVAESGQYSVTFPRASLAGRRVIWRMTAPGFMTTVQFATIPATPLEEIRDIVPDSSALTIPTILHTTWLDGTTVIAGTARDCQGRPLVGANLRLYDAASGSGTPLAGAEVYYSEGGFPVPREDQTATTDDGFFVIFNVVPGPVEVRAVGLIGGVENVIGRAIFAAGLDVVWFVDLWPADGSCLSP